MLLLGFFWGLLGFAGCFCVFSLGLLFVFSLLVLCAVGSGCFLYSLESPFWRLFFEYTAFLPIKKMLQNFHLFLSVAVYVEEREPELFNSLSRGEHM